MTENLDNTQAEETILAEKKVYTSREDILERLAEIAGEATDSAKGEINYLKLIYYKLRQQETDAEMQAFIDGDGDPMSYVAKADELEPRLKELLNVQKEARAKMVQEREQEYASNLAQKEEILSKMEAIANDAEGVGQKYNEFQELQKAFKEVGAVDMQEVSRLWKSYTQINETFYDALKINKELRDYDFKKNLEAKEALCVEAEKLVDMADIVAANRRLQELHDEWRAVGPVAPSQREVIWARFKEASTIVNKRHQEHFLSIKEQETQNEESKTAICDKLEAIDLSQITTIQGWDDATKVVLAFQEEWRKIGFANRKNNNALFDRFRQLCDKFFKTKSEFFNGMHEEQSENLKKKIALCEKAESLKDNTEWRKTTDILVNLQNEWKTIGPVGNRQNNQVWNRFKSACDAFFKAKEEAVGGERAQERANFEAKQEILNKMYELRDNIETATVAAVKELQQKWAEIGHVPFKEKDKLQALYKEVNDVFYAKLDMRGQKRRLENIKERVSKISDGNALQRKLERLQADLKNYENNLGFLTSKSKSGNGMVALMQSKMNDLKAEIEELKKKMAE